MGLNFLCEIFVLPISHLLKALVFHLPQKQVVGDNLVDSKGDHLSQDFLSPRAGFLIAWVRIRFFWLPPLFQEYWGGLEQGRRLSQCWGSFKNKLVKSMVIGKCFRFVYILPFWKESKTSLWRRCSAHIEWRQSWTVGAEADIDNWSWRFERVEIVGGGNSLVSLVYPVYFQIINRNAISKWFCLGKGAATVHTWPVWGHQPGCLKGWHAAVGEGGRPGWQAHGKAAPCFVFFCKNVIKDRGMRRMKMIWYWG